MSIPANLKYSKDHEWARIEGKTATIGITDHAQQALGDIVFVDLPAVGRVLKKHETFGVVESIKAVSDLYSPLEGKVVEVNAALKDDPSKVNTEAYTGAWMLKLEFSGETGDLMDSAAYTSYVATLK